MLKYKTISVYNDTDTFDWKIEQHVDEGWYVNGNIVVAIDCDGNVLYSLLMSKNVAV
jgi:hypothetical protein